MAYGHSLHDAQPSAALENGLPLLQALAQERLARTHSHHLTREDSAEDGAGEAEPSPRSVDSQSVKTREKGESKVMTGRKK